MDNVNLSSHVSGDVVSALLLAAWNVVSFFAEYGLLASIYSLVPELTRPKKIVTDDTEDPRKKKKSSISCAALFSGWRLFTSQGLFVLPSLSLAVLYLTVLSFDRITIGYATAQRLSKTFIGVCQSFGFVFGTLATIAFPPMAKSKRLTHVGLVSYTSQLVCLFGCFVAMWLPGSPFALADKMWSTHVNTCTVAPASQLNTSDTSEWPNATQRANGDDALSRFVFESPCLVYVSVVTLLVSMAVSRFGLWLTDLVIHQLIQENVDETRRGAVGGVQNSLNTAFDLIKYACVIALPDISQYGYLAGISFLAVFVAYCLFVSYVVLEAMGRRRAARESVACGSTNVEEQRPMMPMVNEIERKQPDSSV